MTTVGTARRRRGLAGVAAVAAVLYMAGLPARAADADATATVSASPTPPPESADLGRSVEEVAARLRDIARSLSDGDVFAALEVAVADATHRATARWAETGKALEGHLSPSALDSLESSWDALRAELDDLDRNVDVRTARRDGDLATLAALRTTWERSLDVARTAGEPQDVVDRAQGAIDMIDATRTAVEQRRAKLLVLADRMSRALQTCDDARARIEDVRRAAIARVVTPQRPPLWNWGLSWSPEAADGAPPAADISRELGNARIYAAAYQRELVISVLITVALMLLMRSERAAARAGDAPHGASHLFQTPYASGLLLGLLCSRPLRPTAPFAVSQFIFIAGTIATVCVLRPLVAPAVARYLAALSALFIGLFVVNLATGLLGLPAWMGQALVVAEMTLASLLVLWGLRHVEALAAAAALTPPWQRPARAMAWVTAAGCGVSGIGAALGYLDLADYLGAGLLLALLLALGLLATRVSLDGVVAVALAKGPLTRLHSVRRHHGTIGRVVRRALDVALCLTWAYLVLVRFDLLDPVVAGLGVVFGARLQVGALDLPLSHVLGFAGVVVSVVFLARVVGTLLEDDVYSRMTLPRGVPYALSTLTRYGLLLTGFLLALATLGLDLTRITVLVSALGIGLGFGLQEVMNNFVSGLILLFERPVQVGDVIEMGDVAGEIRRIGIRSSTVRTAQGAEVIVPNSRIIAERVTNWTLSDRHRRIDLDVSVKWAADPERVIALLTDVVRQDARVASTPPPDALLLRFADDEMGFQVRCWTDGHDWSRLRSDLSIALQRALRAARDEASG